jgi:serine protease inhibitor
MQCPRCGAGTYRSLGGKDICPSCGYGSSTGIKAPAALPSTSSYPTSPRRDEQETQSVPQGRESSSESTLTSVSPNTRFGFKLFAEIVRKGTDKNVFISPSSIALALAMTCNGAEGETQQAMAETLELKGISLQDVNQANAVLLAALKGSDPKVELVIANSLWVQKDLAFKSGFLQRNGDFYGAQVANLDFTDPSASSAINSWVKDNTKGKIEDLVTQEELNALTVLVLVNAIYFKGIWKEQFGREETREGPFTLLDGRRKQLPMMSQMGWYEYCECQDFQAVSLPYGEGRISMYIFLPSVAVTLGDFQRSLNANNWRRWLSWFHKAEGTIMLPRFKVEYEVELNDALKALGMGVAFDSGANFEGMCAGPLWISMVRHKTYMEVNEEGTEAAAATAVLMSRSAAERFTMVVDRPFFCAICDNATGEVLFMGSIVEPS